MNEERKHYDGPKNASDFTRTHEDKVSWNGTKWRVSASYDPYVKGLWMIGNIASTVLIVLANKAVMQSFNYPLILTALHQVTIWVITSCWGFYTGQKFSSLLDVTDGLMLGGTNAAGIVFMNLSLATNSVGAYQLLKILNLPTIAILQYSLYSVRLRQPVIQSLAIIIIGVTIASVRELSVDFTGLCFGTIGVLSVSLHQVWVQNRTKAKALSSVHLMAALAPYSTACALIAAGLDLGRMYRGGAVETGNRDSDKMGNGHIVGALFVSCTLAVCSNFTGFGLLKKTSAVTFQVVGHFKTILTITGATVLFGQDAENMDVYRMAGVVVAFIGILIYGSIKDKSTKVSLLPMGQSTAPERLKVSRSNDLR
ncbi:uncharacterized protein SPPG_08151 [Spizellomyces punctatus DAOM BR117]|uniref:Sugar phosphate transporter domain-containing protein n=1 Tax=Spizellomyces punctatus (strain DAOM BR117) TaxID=645134 RepID=A0A0L0H6H8_SPIPD|nr:uncharacterized protein SPPG_08151 [Spizellomyces punctatus DAOM BR117]KNC96564.1 hypothetical protein SPPG_08151 [Spizellomyces punctatus DAOM BR117]|eukprot:XP_016604604.1 hypothetical protein SPPG_08151 [Spizellomyces punctatus DAOM BR117]